MTSKRLLLEAQVEQLEAQANQTAVANRTAMNLVRNEDGLAEAFVAGLSGAELAPIQPGRNHEFANWFNQNVVNIPPE